MFLEIQNKKVDVENVIDHNADSDPCEKTHEKKRKYLVVVYEIRPRKDEKEEEKI